VDTNVEIVIFAPAADIDDGFEAFVTKLLRPRPRSTSTPLLKPTGLLPTGR